MPAPTVQTIIELLSKCASKDDADDIKQSINTYTNEINQKIEHVEDRINIVSNANQQNTDEIDVLRASIELLTQDQLKNNICVSGVPPTDTNNENAIDKIIAIAKTLGIDITRNNLSAQSIANNQFIIARFYNYKHKQQILAKIRIKKSLMVEEVFHVASKSQIYLNDHLTPYFNKLYLIAREAKRDGKIATAQTLVPHQTPL